MGRLIIPHAPRSSFVGSVLYKGELVVAEDTGLLYAGDGATAGGASTGIVAGVGGAVPGPAYIERPELLAPLLNKLLAGRATSINASGDSTIVQTPSVGSVLGGLFTSNFANCTFTRTGASGQHTGDWRTTYLPGEIAANYDANFWGWGMNDIYTPSARNLAAFETDLRAGCAQYRASRPASTNVLVLKSPNTARDDANGRSAANVASLIPIIRKAAADYSCVYVGRFEQFPNAYADATDQLLLDAAGVHPQPPLQALLAEGIFEAVIPAGARSLAASTSSLTFGDANLGITPQVLPAAYPQGRVSLSRATGGSPTWPFDGFVSTFMPTSAGGAFGYQINWAYNYGQPIYAFRTQAATGNAWGEWVYVGLSDPAPVTPNAASFTTPPGVGGMHTRIDGGLVIAQGSLTQTTPATLTVGKVLGQIADTRAYPLIQRDWIDLIATDGSAYERLRGKVTTGGAITCQQAGALTATSIAIADTWNRVIGK